MANQTVDIVNATQCNCHYDDQANIHCTLQATAKPTYFYNISTRPWTYVTDIAPNAEKQLAYNHIVLGVSYQHSDRPDETSVIYKDIATHKGWVVNEDDPRDPNTPYVITSGSLNTSMCQYSSS